MTNTIKIVYADDAVGPYTLHRSHVARRGMMQLLPGQGVDGYGKKIRTEMVLRFEGDTRTYRVYATCYSNAASHWIVRKGEKLWLRTHFQDEILD